MKREANQPPLSRSGGHFEAIRPPGVSPLTPQDVDAYIGFKRNLTAAATPADMRKIIEQAGLQWQHDASSSFSRELVFKYGLQQYQQERLGRVPSLAEHRQALQEAYDATAASLQEADSHTTAFVFGSFANGKVRPSTDLDFIFVVPLLQNAIKRTAELGKLRKGLEDAGWVLAEEFSSVSDIDPVLASGTGYARVFGLHPSGVELDIFVVGENDIATLTHELPRFVHRVRRAEIHPETRTSIKGERREIITQDDRVLNWIEESDGELFVGILIAGMLNAVPMYDPDKKAAQMSTTVWQGFLERFLEKYGAVEYRNLTRRINYDRLPSFDAFFQSLPTGTINKYSEQRFDELRETYYSMLNLFLYRSENKIA